MTKFRIVIVDDVAALRTLLRAVLEASSRFDVVGEAPDGAEAVEVVRGLQPDVVLLDLSMPRMDGLETIPRLVEAAPRCCVVIFSGFEASRMAAPAKRLGATSYIEKGASPREIVAALLKIVGASPAARGAP